MITSGEEKVLGEVVAKLGNGDDEPAAMASWRGVDSSFNRQQGRALERQGACAKVGKVIRRSIGRWLLGNVTGAELTGSNGVGVRKGRREGVQVGFL